MSAKNKILAQYGYPIMFLVYITGVVFGVVLTARFLAGQINAAFDSHPLVAPAITLNRSDAAFVARYLGVSEHPVVPETPAVAPVPAPAPIAAPDTKSLSVRVLNGTSTNGLAGVVKKTLEASGFKNVSTGNAPAKSILTQIQLKPTAASVAPELVSLLQADFVLDASSRLPDASAYDVLLILGSKTP